MSNIVTINNDEITKAGERISGKYAEIITLASREVTSDAEAEAATDLAKRISQAIKQIEDERTSITRPINEGVKAVNAKFKIISEPLEKAGGIVREKLREYMQFKEALAREEAEEARKIAEAEKARQEAEEPNPFPNIAPVAANAVAQVKAPVRGEAATSSLRKQVKWRISNHAELLANHPELFIVAEKVVNERVKALYAEYGLDVPDDRRIAGIELFEESTVCVR